MTVQDERLDLAVGIRETAADPLIQHVLLGEALDSAPLVAFVADDDQKYIAVNQTACELLGYTREELLALRVTEVATAPIAPDLWEEMLRRGTATGVTPLTRKDGSTVLLRYWARETKIAGMTFYVSLGLPEAG